MWYGAAKKSFDEPTVLRKFTLFLFIIALFVAPVLVRVVTESHRALEAARAAVARGDLDAGFAAYEEAIRWSAPFHRYGAVAREELFAVVRSPERTTDERRRGLELLVSALETSRHGLTLFDTRRDDILRDARSKLEEFRGADVYGARLSTPPQVRFPIQALAQLFFWCWVLLLARLSWKGFDERARPQWAVLKRSALPFVAAYGLWLAALRLA